MLIVSLRLVLPGVRPEGRSQAGEDGQRLAMNRPEQAVFIRKELRDLVQKMVKQILEEFPWELMYQWSRSARIGRPKFPFRLYPRNFPDGRLRPSLRPDAGGEAF